MINDSLRLEIFNTPELAQLFDEMTVELQHRVIAAGFRKSAKIVLDETRANLYTATRAADKIAKVIGTKAPKGELEVMLGVRKKGYGNLAHLIEDGTVNRYYIGGFKKSGKKSLLSSKKHASGYEKFKIQKGQKHPTGKMTGQHFFADAIETTQQPVMDTLYKNISDAFIRLLKKYDTQKRK